MKTRARGIPLNKEFPERPGLYTIANTGAVYLLTKQFKVIVLVQEDSTVTSPAGTMVDLMHVRQRLVRYHGVVEMKNDGVDWG